MVDAVEPWTEVNLEPVTALDGAPLTDVVDGLVHEEFRADLETWFFFWEPELRLRLRWVDAGRTGDCRERLAARLDGCKSRGLIVDWFEGAHGRRGEIYAGGAEMYGSEAWSLAQKDWMNGSEFALLLAKLERRGALTRPRRFHWERHVHLFTNQLYGTWDSEVELCLSQALGYLRHIVAGGRPPSAAAASLLTELNDLFPKE